MTDREAALRQRLMATFVAELDEHVTAMTSNLLDLERMPEPAKRAQLLETVFRGAHSLKGAARAVNISEIENICHTMETLLSDLKKGKVALEPEHVDQLLKSVKKVDALREGLGSTPVPTTTRPAPAAGAVAVTAAPPPPLQVPPSTLADEFVRVPAAKLEEVRVQTEELLSEKIAANQQTSELREVSRVVSEWRKRWGSLRGELRALEPGSDRDIGGERALSRIAEFLEWNRTFVETLHVRLGQVSSMAASNERALCQKVDELLKDARNLTMLPCSWLLDGMRPVVRDLARAQGKEVQLAIEGGSIEVDRRILTELKDPFIHALRNCVDHGIETPAARRAAGKNVAGTISVSVTQVAGGNVLFRISDDGRGIDVAAVRAAAVRAGALDAAAATELGAEESLQMVLQSGVSTAPIVTDLSGRGLGLAIVRDRIAAFGGKLAIVNTPGAGLTLDFVLPVTRKAFRGIVVKTGGESFVVPTSSVERAVRVLPSELTSVEGHATLMFDGAVSFFRLADVLGLRESARMARKDAKTSMLIVGVDGKRIAFGVEEVREELEVLVKDLGPHLRDLRGVSGATVLGTGEVAPILDVGELVRIALGGAGAAAMRGPTAAEQMESRVRRILLAEDSITSRTLLRNIMEGAGYSVATAIDGMEALAKLRAEPFDLLVSDVEMPRMKGLDLTEKVRADPKLAAIPVVLVTSLDSREDRERGIEVGANAYIVKSSFEQSNLLEVIRQLL